MNTFRTALAALLCATSMPLAAAQPSTPAIQVDPGAESLELADLYIPEAIIRREGEAGYRTSFKAGFDQDPTSAKMEEAFPGIYQKALDAGLGTLTYAYDHGLPDIRKQVAVIFEQQLTSVHRRNVIAFYKSPVGRKTVDLAASTANVSDLEARMAEDRDQFALSRNDIGKIVDPRFLGQMSKDELKELGVFGASSAGRQFLKIRPQIEEIVVSGINALIQSLAVAQQEAISEAVANHITSFQKAKDQ